MELHKRKVFSAGTTSATCNKLCDQNIATRTARWVHRSCAKMEERTEFRVYSGPDHSHCIPKWPATITGRLNVSHYSCLLFHRRLLILGSNRRLVSPFLVLNKMYKRGTDFDWPRRAATYRLASSSPSSFWNREQNVLNVPEKSFVGSPTKHRK